MTRSLFIIVAMTFIGGPTLAGVVPPTPRLPGPILRPPPAEKPDETSDDPAAIAERIAKNTKAAADRLADKDTGDDTRKTQEQTLKDIDALLKQAGNPPPQGEGGGAQDMPPPQGGDGSPKQDQSKGGGQQPQSGQPNQGGGKSGQSRSARSGRKSPGMPAANGAQQQTPGGVGRKKMPLPTAPQPRPGDPSNLPATQAGMPRPGGTGPGLPLDDPIAKQVWGHLPEKLRQQMSQYYREQFMPKYSPLIRDYFNSLAERERKK